VTGAVVWFTGLPASGKTTLAKAVQERLTQLNRAVCLLDSDEVRDVLLSRLGYTEGEREAFYAMLARLAGLLARQGLLVLVAATAHRNKHREQARQVAPHFIEVYVATPIEECRRRDPKGLYARARTGELTSLPGAEIDYETPANPDVIAQGGLSAGAVGEILRRIRDVAPPGVNA